MRAFTGARAPASLPAWTNAVDYGYDDLGQLTSALGAETGGAPRWHERFFYAYDAAGNLRACFENQDSFEIKPIGAA